MAACLHYACLEADSTGIPVAYKPSEFATFMQLGTKGFSRGDTILRELNKEGKIHIKINVNLMQPFLTR
jgi:hypothetical protein